MLIQTRNKAANYEILRRMDAETPHTLLKAAKMIAALHHLPKGKPDYRNRFVSFWESQIRTVEL